MKHPGTASLAQAARDRAGMTQEAFAKMIRAGLRTVRAWEAGDKPPNPTTQLMLEEIRDGWLPTTERERRQIEEPCPVCHRGPDVGFGGSCDRGGCPKGGDL
jgi:DNA-binding XRE family transcriptional regulator